MSFKRNYLFFLFTLFFFVPKYHIAYGVSENSGSVFANINVQNQQRVSFKRILNTKTTEKSSLIQPLFTLFIAEADTNKYDFQIHIARQERLNVFNKNKNLYLFIKSSVQVDSVFDIKYKMADDTILYLVKKNRPFEVTSVKPGNYCFAIAYINEINKVTHQNGVSFIIESTGKDPVIVIISGLFGLMLLFFIYKRFRFFDFKSLRNERNITPAQKYFPNTAVNYSGAKNERIIQSQGEEGRRRTRWDKYDMVTVLFSDIQGFTKLAEQLNPEVLVDELDKFFFHFDSVVGKYNIEKIKTIGDAYMAAGGIPKRNHSNPIEVVMAAMEMQVYMKNLQVSKFDFWDLRIGIHTGPVIAGIIGQIKRSYDIWGDTVNTASRMESSGVGGKVNISGETYNLVKDYFICEYRGKLPVKYKGNLDMYFITGIRPELSVNLQGLPNRKFFLKLQILRLEDIEEMVFSRLSNESPAHHHFHNLSYARHIYSFSQLLCKAENLDMEEVLLIRTAVLMIPLGYLDDYKNAEKEGARLSEMILPQFKYSEKQIRNVSNLILASKLPLMADSILEKVMIDICFEYLGRRDFMKLNRLLYLEITEYFPEIRYSTWQKDQSRLLDSFTFYTLGAQRLCEVSFEKQIENIQNEFE